MAVTRVFFFFLTIKGTAWDLCAKWCPTKGKYGYGEQKPAGQRQKWLQKEILKQPKQPPKLPQTAPTTLLQLKVYLATLGTDGRSQD